MMRFHCHTPASPSSFSEARLCFGLASGVESAYNSVKQTAVEFWDKFTKDVDAETAKNLTSNEKWVSAFSDPGLDFDAAPVPLAPGVPYGPEQLLKSMSVVQRKQTYLDCIRSFISLPVQKEIFGDDPPSFDEARAKIAQVSAVLRGTMGMDVPALTPEEAALAKKNLRFHYNLQDGGSPNPTKGVVDDYQTALRYQRMPGSIATVTDPAVLADKLPASRMKGALQLGAIDAPQLQKLNDIAKKLDQDKALAKAEIAGNIGTLKAETKEVAKDNASTLSNAFSALGGWEKLIVVGIGVWAMVGKSKAARFARGSALVLGGTYLAQRIFMKDQDPVGSWKKWLGGGVDYAKETITGSAAEKADAYVNFLDDFDRSRLEQQGTAFGVLSKTSLKDLASSMEFTGQLTHPFDLNMKDDSVLGLSMKANEATNKEMTFLRDPANKKAASDAVSFVFYSMASKNPSAADDVRLVEEASRYLKPHDSPADLFGHEMDADPVRREAFRKGSEAYQRLVVQGRDIALHSSQSLSSYVAENATRPLAEVSPPAPAAAAGPTGTPTPPLAPTGAVLPTPAGSPTAPAPSPPPTPPLSTSTPAPGPAASGPLSPTTPLAPAPAPTGGMPAVPTPPAPSRTP